MCTHLSYIFREATLGDISGLAEIHAISWKVAYAGKITSSYLNKISIDQKIEKWKTTLQNCSCKTFLAEDKLDNKVVGFISFGNFRDDDISRKGKVGEIRALYVSPDLWRSGIGKQLVKLTENECREIGYEYLVLWVLDSNEDAQKFYQSLDFLRDDGIKIDTSIPECELIEYRYSKRI